MANDKQSQRSNKYNGNKNVVIIGIIVGVLIVAILGTLFIKTNNNKSIKIDYDTYTTVTAKPGQEYTTKDKDGNLYYIKSDGMYCDTDYGQIKVEYHKPLNKFNTYSYTNEALTVTTFDINKDGTYTYTVYYTTGCRDVFTGKYDIAVGVNNAFKALNIKDKQEFTDAFFVDSGAIDPNNLVVLTMNKKSLTSYDENGNPVKYLELDVQWKSGRQLSKIAGLDDDGNEEAYAAFAYDENGIRTSEHSIEDSLTFDFTTEDGAITGRQSADGKNYRFIYDESGKPTAFLMNGALYHYITNQMGDVVGITDADGNLALEYFYDAWGDNFTRAIDQCDFDGEEGGLGAYKLSNANPLTYRGYYFDHAIGMYYLQSRYMNPVVNRFFNADDPDIAKQSKDVPVGMNLFAYCNNDPVNKVDPDGRLSIKTGFSKILNKIQHRIQDYFANLIVKKNGIIRISVTVIAAGLNFIVSMVVAKLVYKGVTSLLNKVVDMSLRSTPGV